MVEPDTIRLLRECDAGIKMGVSAISDVVDRVADKHFRRLLTDCKAQHDKLKAEIQTTDGCNMGVKSLSQYLNQYQAADETSKDITKRLIALEERLAVDIRGFL